jgi:hypothetical protein
MPWHIGPLRERVTGLPTETLAANWHQFVQQEAAESKARWRLDAYITSVSAPVTIADTFIDEWLKGLWRTDHK